MANKAEGRIHKVLIELMDDRMYFLTDNFDPEDLDNYHLMNDEKVLELDDDEYLLVKTLQATHEWLNKQLDHLWKHKHPNKKQNLGDILPDLTRLVK
jgi:hypothetical protein